MLGRHVYRVTPLATAGWQVRKEGEEAGRGTRRTRTDAVALAETLAAADQPSRLIVEDEGGVILDERLYGADGAATPGDDTPLGRETGTRR